MEADRGYVREQNAGWKIDAEHDNLANREENARNLNTHKEVGVNKTQVRHTIREGESAKADTRVEGCVL